MLSEVVKKNNLTRKDIHDFADVGYPAISKYFNGHAMPRPKILAKIMSKLPNEDASELFSAYVKESFKEYERVDSLLGCEDDKQGLNSADRQKIAQTLNALKKVLEKEGAADYLSQMIKVLLEGDSV